MAPGGEGTITLEMPPWYSNSGTDFQMYNPEAEDKCSSDCMKITNSGLVETSNVIKIDYTQMVDSCIKGQEIMIRCRQFRNPITPNLWTGFRLSYFDNEGNSKRIIEQTSFDLGLDASGFSPDIIPL